MSNSYIGVGEPATVTKKLDTEQLLIGANTVERERVQITGSAEAEIAKVSNSTPLSSQYGLVVRPVLADTASPQTTYTTQATVAAAGQATLDSESISASKTGHLMGFTVASSVPIKAELRTVADNIASTNILVIFTGSERTFNWKSPGRGYISVNYSASAGLDGFRLIVTNLDTSESADVYCTFFYDEE